MRRVLALGPLLVLAACGSDDAVSVTDAWARASATGQTQGAVYFDLTVPDDDLLVRVSVPASVAAGAEIHDVVAMAGDDMTGDDMTGDEMEAETGSDGMDGSSMMQMRELSDGLVLSAGETVSFEPGSYHVMLPELTEPLVVGDRFELTLDLARADDVTVTIEVADSEP